MKAKRASAPKPGGQSKSPGRPRSEEARAQILDSAYQLLKTKPMSAIAAHEIAKDAGVSTATLYRWWKTKEEIMFEACLEHLKGTRTSHEEGSPSARLRDNVSSSAKWTRSEYGKVMARIIAGIQGDEELQRSYLEKFYFPRRRVQRQLIEEAIAAGELKAGTDPELLIDVLFGPLFFRWLQGHAPVDQNFANAVVDNVLRVFER